MNYTESFVLFLVLCSELNAEEFMKNKTEGNSNAGAVILKNYNSMRVRIINYTAGLILVCGDRHTGRCPALICRHVFPNVNLRLGFELCF
jgi:hypothetical protein